MIYLSYPMTRATVFDERRRKELRERLRAEKVEVYDPELENDPKSPVSVWQAADFSAMSASKAVVAVWPRYELSVGQLAELEWAKRVFFIPAVVWFPPQHLPIPDWTKCTVNGKIFPWLEEAIKWLKEKRLIPTKPVST